MKTSKYLPKKDQNLWTKFSPIYSPVIMKINGEDSVVALVLTEKFRIFRNVHPEFVNFSKIPFQIFTTIRIPAILGKDRKKLLLDNDWKSSDPILSFSKERNSKQRKDYCHDLAKKVNAILFEKYPDAASGLNTAKFVFVEEFGESDEVHVHLLWHLDERAEHLAPEVLTYLNNLEPKEVCGVRCFVSKLIYDKLGAVSYFCKVEKGRPYKEFEYSPRFRSTIKRKIRQGHWQ
jgi:hypothetical protein